MSADRADHRRDQVERKQQAAVFVGDAFVEPAFDDEVASGNRKARYGAKRDPGAPVDDEAAKQDCDGKQRDQRREDAHMADAQHEFRRDDAG
ncbi:hypothetical protein D9M72_586540 [compost metagenome]